MPDNRRPIQPLLFPAEPRLFTGQRGVNILLRAIHLVGIAGIGGGFLHGLAEAIWLPFWYLTLASGVGLCMLYTYSSALWLLQLRGLAVLVKLLLIGMAIQLPGLGGALFIAVIVISAIIAHAPGSVRGWQPFKRGGR